MTYPEKSICQYCNKSFKPSLNSSGKFCSTDCYHKSTRTEFIVFTCQYCEKVFTKTDKHIYKFCSVHCARKGRKIRKDANLPKKLICKYCDKPFERIVRPSKKTIATFEFCSPICRNKSREKKNIPCPICGEMFKPVNRKYCTQECGWEAQIGKPSSKRTLKHIRDFIRKTYPIQGPEPAMKKFNLTHSSVKNIAYKEKAVLTNEAKYERQYKKSKERMTGPTNPMWKGGIAYLKFGENWEKQRIKVLNRDNYICQVCFEFGNVVHHIIPRRKFKIVEHSNKLSNLITLCDKHHVPVEVGKTPCPLPSG